MHRTLSAHRGRAFLLATLVIGSALPLPVIAQGVTGAPQGGDKALIAQGENIFKGKAAGGLCWTCHGMDAKGMKGLGPDLTDKTWLHGDGSVEFVKATVRAGVPKPKKGGTPMPPGGGIALTDGQLEAVAAYVASLSTGAKK